MTAQVLVFIRNAKLRAPRLWGVLYSQELATAQTELN